MESRQPYNQFSARPRPEEDDLSIHSAGHYRDKYRELIHPQQTPKYSYPRLDRADTRTGKDTSPQLVPDCSSNKTTQAFFSLQKCAPQRYARGRGQNDLIVAISYETAADIAVPQDLAIVGQPLKTVIAPVIDIIVPVRCWTITVVSVFRVPLFYVIVL